MTDAQVEHLWSALAEFQRVSKYKYAAGAKQHGGNLWDHTAIWLVEQAMDECVDQWMYLKTARDQLRAQEAQNHVMISTEGVTPNGKSSS